MRCCLSACAPRGSCLAVALSPRPRVVLEQLRGPSARWDSASCGCSQGQPPHARREDMRPPHERNGAGSREPPDRGSRGRSNDLEALIRRMPLRAKVAQMVFASVFGDGRDTDRALELVRAGTGGLVLYEGVSPRETATLIGRLRAEAKLGLPDDLGEADKKALGLAISADQENGAGQVVKSEIEPRPRWPGLFQALTSTRGEATSSSACARPRPGPEPHRPTRTPADRGRRSGIRCGTRLCQSSRSGRCPSRPPSRWPRSP